MASRMYFNTNNNGKESTSSPTKNRLLILYIVVIGSVNYLQKTRMISGRQSSESQLCVMSPKGEHFIPSTTIM